MDKLTQMQQANVLDAALREAGLTAESNLGKLVSALAAMKARGYEIGREKRPAW